MTTRKISPKKAEAPVIVPVGFRPKEYAKLVGLGRTALYLLPEELKPHSVRVGGARIITERPDAWLSRMAGVHAQRAAEQRAAA